jgi:hypothetical protein
LGNIGHFEPFACGGGAHQARARLLVCFSLIFSDDEMNFV